MMSFSKTGFRVTSCVLGIGIAQRIDRAGLFVHPAGLNEAVHLEGLAAQGDGHAVGLGVRRDAALDALAAVIGDGVFRLCAAVEADTVYEVVLFRDPNGLGGGRGAYRSPAVPYTVSTMLSASPYSEAGTVP